MNTDEIVSAIESLEYLIGGDCCDNQMAFVDEIELALAALRENQERENGCEYCNSRFAIATHHITESGMKAGTNKTANFCPMCGRRLEETPSDWTKNKACRDAVLKTFGGES